MRTHRGLPEFLQALRALLIVVNCLPLAAFGLIVQDVVVLLGFEAGFPGSQGFIVN